MTFATFTRTSWTLGRTGRVNAMPRKRDSRRQLITRWASFFAFSSRRCSLHLVRVDWVAKSKKLLSIVSSASRGGGNTCQLSETSEPCYQVPFYGLQWAVSPGKLIRLPAKLTLITGELEKQGMSRRNKFSYNRTGRMGSGLQRHGE